MGQKIIITVLLSFLLVSAVQAVGVKVKPAQLNFQSWPGIKATSEILVINTQSEPTVYQAYPDKYKKNIIIKPAEFKLEGGGSQIVKVTSWFYVPAIYHTALSVVALPTDVKGLVTGAGVKLPLTIQIKGALVFWLLLALTILLVLNFIVQIRRKSRSLLRG